MNSVENAQLAALCYKNGAVSPGEHALKADHGRDDPMFVHHALDNSADRRKTCQDEDEHCNQRAPLPCMHFWLLWMRKNGMKEAYFLGKRKAVVWRETFFQ